MIVISIMLFLVKDKMERSFTTFFLAFNIFLGVIGSFTLLVGGVGVASIMMVVVEERTREIGIKLAVGARRRTILVPFFSETLMIMTLGGIIGFALSAWLLQSVRQDQPAWREIVKIASRPDAQAAFGEWVETRRSERTMKNDDVTCLVAVMR